MYLFWYNVKQIFKYAFDPDGLSKGDALKLLFDKMITILLAERMVSGLEK
jgi:hypothetical protein